ncbi:ankyrin repeat domain-containing protein [unidentified bacterial endosymbiont]|uniref:ankyrin repeat domain-containing protein n=1 Tax=unidentified bacterial endosymbiont TaxID=2355 RepID=UPI0020A18BB6|nr:ankyrin repeat domain-containing protein [unidentified bacterial endosymbiont]
MNSLKKFLNATREVIETCVNRILASVVDMFFITRVVIGTCVNRRLANAVEINIQDHRDTSRLHLAVQAGDIAPVNSLRDHGADINIQDHRGFTPLHLATWKGDIATVNSLLGRGADVNIHAHNGVSPLFFAIMFGGIAIVDSLLDHGADINIQSLGGTPLHFAVSQGDIAIINSLLDHGADVNILDPRISSSCLDCVIEQQNRYAKALSLHSNKKILYKQEKYFFIAKILINHGATDQELEENIGLISDEMITVRAFIQENDPERLVQYIRYNYFIQKLTAVRNQSLKFKNMIEQQFLLAQKQELCARGVGLIELKIVFRGEEISLPAELMEKISYYLTEGDSNTFMRACLDPAKITENCNALYSCAEPSNIFTNPSVSCDNFYWSRLEPRNHHDNRAYCIGGLE